MSTTPTTPAIPSADAAAAQWDATAPSTPATPATPSTPTTPAAAAPNTPATPATPADAPITDAASLEGIADLLADDLKTPVAAPAIDPAADPLAAVKDVPRFQEMVAAETTLKTAMAASEYIKDPAHVAEAVRDADVLWKISEGKANVSEILIAAKAANPETFAKILGDFKEFYEQETGQQLAAAAAGVQPQTEEQKRLALVEKELADRKTAETQAATAKRVGAARTKVLENINASLKGTWLEGEGEDLLKLAGTQLGADSTMKVVEAAEKGDFSQINKALIAARSQEAVKFKARIDRMTALKKAKAATIPTQVAGGTVPAVSDQVVSNVEMDAEKRRASMVAQLRG